MTLLFTQHFRLSLPKKSIAEIATNAERHCGVAGGGMDQASITLSKENCAQLISFSPLRSQIVKLPDNIRFFVASSEVNSKKAVDASKCYNRRVFECKVACLLILKIRGIPPSSLDKAFIESVTLRQVQEDGNMTITECLQFLKDTVEIPRDGVSGENLRHLLGPYALLTLTAKFLGFRDIKDDNFHPYRRAVHVLSEADRVLEFASVCSSHIQETDKIDKLGRLMKESHASCRDLYDCSCKQLEDLTNYCLQNGALGARLTGAGWGGFAVSMILRGESESFSQQLAKYFGDIKPGESGTGKDKYFPVECSDGARLYGVCHADCELISLDAQEVNDEC